MIDNTKDFADRALQILKEKLSNWLDGPVGYNQRFFLSHPAFGEREVTREEFIVAGCATGLFPKSGSGVVTGGFSSGDILISFR